MTGKTSQHASHRRASKGGAHRRAGGRGAARRADASAQRPLLERAVERATSGLRHRAERAPVLGALAFGGLGLFAATTLGVGEFAVAAAAAYLGYRLLRDREGFGRAAHEVAKAAM